MLKLPKASYFFYKLYIVFYAYAARIGLGKNKRLQKIRRTAANYESGSTAQKVFLALEAFFCKSIYAEDMQQMVAAERLRQKLAADETKIQRKDFGAGITRNLYHPVKEISVSRLSKGSGMPQPLAKMLYTILRFTRPVKSLELGTCLGISGAYIGLALQANGFGTLLTIEGDEQSAEIARQNFKKLGLENINVENGRFAEVLPGILPALGKIDFALIDGHHNGAATLQYFETLKPYLSANAILAFDDIDWSADMRVAWHALQQEAALYICINMGRMGVCIYNAEPQPAQRLFIPV